MKRLLSKKLQDLWHEVSEPALSLARYGQLERRPVSDCMWRIYHICLYIRLRGHALCH